MPQHRRALSPRPTTRALAGSVETFDDAIGLGVVSSGDGDTFAFHCTAVADGSRHVEAGTAVWFRLRPAHRGRFEAYDLVPSPSRAGTS